MIGDRARILILDDRAPDRLYLTTLLGYRGFVVFEAENGEQGLAVAAREPLDLVISDVLMPIMDGYEFVRHLRQSRSGSDVPVIFYTATYHQHEARALAEECGVVEIMTKPSEPEAILARIDAVLARGRVDVPPIADGPFDRQHARLTTDKLVEIVRDLEASERRLAAIVEIGQRFIEERNPVALLNRVCQTVREVTLASYALVGLFSEDLERIDLVLTSGHDERTAAFLRQASEIPPPVRALATDRRPKRARNPGGRPENVSLPPWHAPVHSYMLVPMGSRGRVYGFFAVGEKIGAPEFSEADEIVAVTLGVQAGIAYENARLINALEAQASALRESEATTEFALSAARIGVFQRDLATDRITSVMASVPGFPVRTGATFDDAYNSLHPEDRPRARAIVEQAIADRKKFSFDARTLDHQGRVSYCQMRGQIVLDASSAPERVLSVVIDITELRQLEAQLRQAQKMEAIGLLAGGVAHDFNNLLTAILGYARFLVPTLEDAQQRNDVDEIIRAGERAVGLTRQLLAFSRRHAQELTVFDLNILIRDVTQMLRRLIGEHVSLTTSLAPSLAPVFADRGQVEQVIMNLAVNARDAMPSGGKLCMETANVIADGADMIALVVADTGTGMSKETKARLFEPFFTTKEAGKGTGLGLATVFGIITQSGGTVTVESTLGQGTAFTVRLPRASGSLTASSPPEVTVVHGTESLFLVEDDEAVRMLARTMLQRAGYRVTEAGNVPDAIRLAATQSFDLLIADVVMPGGTGPELFNDLLKSRPTLRVLYMSGYARETILDTRQLGKYAGFLAKPFTEASLTQKVREVLDR